MALRGCLAMFGDILVVAVEWRVLLAARGERPGMLLHVS